MYCLSLLACSNFLRSISKILNRTNWYVWESQACAGLAGKQRRVCSEKEALRFCSGELWEPSELLPSTFWRHLFVKLIFYSCIWTLAQILSPASICLKCCIAFGKISYFPVKSLAVKHWITNCFDSVISLCQKIPIRNVSREWWMEKGMNRMTNDCLLHIQEHGTTLKLF